MVVLPFPFECLPPPSIGTVETKTVEPVIAPETAPDVNSIALS